MALKRSLRGFSKQQQKRLLSAASENSTLYLRRYSDLSALIYMLTERCATFLDASTWEDRNDAYCLEQYKERSGLKALLVLCFTQGPERYHYWRSFGAGPSGVCIEFHRSEFLRAIEGPGISRRAVRYIALAKRKQVRPSLAGLPFAKRVGFKDEREYRVIYESDDHTQTKLDVGIPLSCINKVILSPQMHPALVQPIADLLRSIDGCEGLKITHSRLIDSEEWQALARSAT